MLALNAVPADLLGVVGVVGLALALAAVVLCVRARNRLRRRPAVIAGVVTGLATTTIWLALSGFRRYRSDVPGPGHRGVACTDWYIAIAHHGRPGCHAAAVDAIVPAVLEGTGFGVLAGAIAVLLLERQRRRNVTAVESALHP